MVANICAGLRQLGECILLLSSDTSIFKSPSPTQPALLFPRPPHLTAFTRFSCGQAAVSDLQWPDKIHFGLVCCGITLALFFPATSDRSAPPRLVVAHRRSGSAILHMALLACKPESPTTYSSMLQVFHMSTGR